MAKAAPPTAIGTLVKRLREERGFTQGQLATYANVSRSWVALVERHKRPRPDPDLLRQVARALQVPAETLMAAAGYRVTPLPMPNRRTPEELMTEAMAALRREREEAVYAVPVEGVASAGPGAYQDDHAYIGQAELKPELRRLTVTGDCMRGTIEPGDVVIVDVEASYREGQVVAARKGDRVIVKRFHGDELRGDDGTVERAADWTIVGLVIARQQPLS